MCNLLFSYCGLYDVIQLTEEIDWSKMGKNNKIYLQTIWLLHARALQTFFSKGHISYFTNTWTAELNTNPSESKMKEFQNRIVA